MSNNVPTYATWQNNTHPSWWKDPGLRRCVRSIAVLYLCVWSFGYDGSLLNGLQTMPRWQAYFDYPKGNRLGLISAVYYLPKLVVGYVASWMAEKYGRRLPLVVGCVLLIGGAVLCTVCKNDAELIGGRLLVGLGTGFMATVSPPLIAEIAHPRLRSISGAMFLCTFYVGTTMSAWLCYGLLNVTSDWGWRAASLIQCAGAIVVLFYVLSGLMPESPRHLVAHGKEDAAFKLLADLHANGDPEDELVRNEFAEIKQGLEQDKLLEHTGYTAFLKTSGNRRRLGVVVACAVFAQINGVGLVSYYLVPILSLVGITQSVQQAGINGGLAIWNLIVAACAAQFVDRWGRRPLWLTSSIGTLGAFVFVAALSGSFASTRNAATGAAVIPFLFIFYGFYCIGFTVLPNLYVPEILPYHLRTKGMGIYIFAQACTLAFNQWVNPVALQAIAWRYYLVYLGVQVVILVVVYIYFIETKGHTIEEVSRLFDKPKGGATQDEEMEPQLRGDDNKLETQHEEDRK